MNRTRSATGVASYSLAIAALVAACNLSPVRACNTPVFRYAMYNWPAAPYYVFYFHHGQIAQEDKAVNKMLDGLADAEPPTNVMLEVVDVTQEEQLKRLPGVVKKARQEHADGTKPLHLVYTAWGAQLFAGRLDAAAVRAMVDSPVRKRLGKLFHEGNGIVLLILTGPDEKANKEAEKAAGGVVAKAAAGEIAVSSNAPGAMMPAELLPKAPGGAPDDAADDAPDGDDQNDSSETLKIAVVKVSRTEGAEKWLVDSLLSIEPDLRDKKFSGKAMVFAVYGRGRAMPPFIGKGISVKNLIECVEFLAGPCSCMIKDQNPGRDLLMRWDWDATAEKMAEKDPAFAGGPFGYQEFVPDDSGNLTEPQSPNDGPAKAPSTSPEDGPAKAPGESDPEA